MKHEAEEVDAQEDDGIHARFEVCVLVGGVVEDDDSSEREVDAGGEEDGGDGYADDLSGYSN